MPIDINAGSNIPLSGTPAPPAVAPTSLLDALAKVQGIRNSRQLASQSAAESAQTLATGAQTQQENSIKIQQAQQDLKDQQIYADALKASSMPTPPPPGAPPGTAPTLSPPDPNAVLMRMLQDPRGLSGKAAQAQMANVLALREKNAAIAKDTALANSDNATAQGKHAEAIVGATGSLISLGAPDDPAAEAARAAAYPQMRQQLIDAGHLTDAQAPMAYPGITWLQQEHNGLQTGIQQLAEQKGQQDLADAKAEEARKAALAPGALTEQQNKALTSTPNAAGLTAAEQKEADDREAARDAAALNAANELSVNKGKLTVEQARLEMEKQMNGVGAPGSVSPAAQMGVDGRLDPATLRSMIRKNPGLITQMIRIDPAWDEGDIDNRYKVLSGMGSSTLSSYGGQTLALNTLIHHADLYLQAADALKNGTWRPGNAAYNAVASSFGSAPPTNSNLVAQFLAGETSKVATGGVPAEGQIKDLLKPLSNEGSPEQMRQAGQKLLEIASGRMIPIQEKVKEAHVGNIVHVLGPDAQEILKRRGFDPTTMKPVDAKVKAYADSYFGGDVGAAQAAIAKQRGQ